MTLVSSTDISERGVGCWAVCEGERGEAGISKFLFWPLYKHQKLTPHTPRKHYTAWTLYMSQAVLVDKGIQIKISATLILKQTYCLTEQSLIMQALGYFVGVDCCCENLRLYESIVFGN